jgi:hypothetical protein
LVTGLAFAAAAVRVPVLPANAEFVFGFVAAPAFGLAAAPVLAFGLAAALVLGFGFAAALVLGFGFAAALVLGFGLAAVFGLGLVRSLALAEALADTRTLVAVLVLAVVPLVRAVVLVLVFNFVAIELHYLRSSTFSAGIRRRAVSGHTRVTMKGIYLPRRQIGAPPPPAHPRCGCGDGIVP